MHHWHLERRYAGGYMFLDGISGGYEGGDQPDVDIQIDADPDPAYVIGGSSTASTVDPKLVAFFADLKRGGASADDSASSESVTGGDEAVVDLIDDDIDGNITTDSEDSDVDGTVDTTDDTNDDSPSGGSASSEDQTVAGLLE